MKKISLGILVCILVTLLASSLVSAVGNAVENSKMRIIIDGKLGTYADVPIIVNDRSMLPLRALLNNLGVADQFIIWNDDERSVTIFSSISKGDRREAVRVFLKIDSEIAYVNDTVVTLDAAPIIYKNKTYIPTRFVAQSLGKKVVWDEATTSVLIRDENEYNKVMDIMNKTNTAMEAITKLKIFTDTRAAGMQNGRKTETTAKSSFEIDRVKRIIHINSHILSMGQSTYMETYFANNSMYMKDPYNGKWRKNIFSAEQYDNIFSSSDSTALLKPNEVLYAGLIIDSTQNNMEIVLKGDIYLQQLKSLTGITLKNENGVKLEIKKLFSEIYIDKETYRITRVNMNGDIEMSFDDKRVQQNQIINIVYTDYDGNFELDLPVEIEKNASKVNVP